MALRAAQGGLRGRGGREAGLIVDLDLFGVPVRSSVNRLLSERHYLGPIDRGEAYADQFGVMIFANPTARRLPQGRWLELVRWCLLGEKNGGSRQWAAARRWLLSAFPAATTVVSYSDPSVGHTGALYRACNWQWAPTWHRLRPPPSGNGNWGSGKQAVKDRWVACLRPDPDRQRLLRVADEALRKRYPWAEFPGDYKKFVQLSASGLGQDPLTDLPPPV